MKRGDIVVAAAGGDYGKPRPYVVVQGDDLHLIGSVLLCPITTDVQGALFRVEIAQGPATGLRSASEIMVEKIQAVKRERIRQTIGQLDADAMLRVDDKLALVLGLRG